MKKQDLKYFNWIKRRKIWLIVFILMAGIGVWLRYSSQEKTLVLSAELSGPIKIEAQTIQYQTAQPQAQSFGSLSFEDAVSVSPMSDGTIEEIFVNEGDFVKKGELLVRLIDLQLNLQYSKAKSTLNSVEIAYELAKIRYTEGRQQIEAKLLRLKKTRLQLALQQKEIEVLKDKLQDQKDLYAIDGLSAQALADMEFQLEAKENSAQQAEIEFQIEKIGYRREDLLKAGFEEIPADATQLNSLYIELNSRNLASELAIAKAKISAAEDELNSIKILVESLDIRSPIDGILVAKQLSKGQRVKIDNPLLTIINQEKLYVVFPLQESLIKEITIGDSIKIDLPSLGKNVKGKIEIVNPVVDSSSGNFMVKALIDDQKQAKQGMFASISLPLGEQRKRILIPKNVLLDGENKENRVFIVSDQYILIRNINIGMTFEASKNGVEVEVLQGLKEGDILVTSRNPNLREGLEVEIRAS